MSDIPSADWECDDRWRIIKATAGLKRIPVLAVHWINGDCQLCAEYTRPNICQLPSGKNEQLCDECVKQIWNRAGEPEEREQPSARTETGRDAFSHRLQEMSDAGFSRLLVEALQDEKFFREFRNMICQVVQAQEELQSAST